MSTYNLPLTYPPKIEPVKIGDCHQTIRKLNQSKPKEIGDFVRFHTWAGRPYWSEWSWTSGAWPLNEVLRIAYDPFHEGWYWARLVDHKDSGVYLHKAIQKITPLELLGLAQMDYITPPESMTDLFVTMHPKMKTEYVGFEVLRWPSSSTSENVEIPRKANEGGASDTKGGPDSRKSGCAPVNQENEPVKGDV